MINTNTHLWQRILAFDLDQPAGSYTFSLRLAREHYWTRCFTEAAIREYKKFMYLAATSDFMVSPSPIIDIVWHQHLIFTQSYTAFCELQGKRIEHVPSTHNSANAARFREAKARTNAAYTPVFGEQPAGIWEHADMYSSLGLEKARMKLRSFLLWGIAGLLIAVPLTFFSLGWLVYPHIDGKVFLLTWSALAIAAFALLELHTRRTLRNWLHAVPAYSFLFNLRPEEVMYLEKESPDPVIHQGVNKLVRKEIVAVGHDNRIKIVGNPVPSTPEEYVILEGIKQRSGSNYGVLYYSMRTKPVFMNTANAMQALRKYVLKSHVVFRLFRLHFYVLGTLFVLAVTRIITGIYREKPVGYLIILLILFVFLAIAYISRLNNLPVNKMIVGDYRDRIAKLPENDRETWRFFLLGRVALAPALAQVIGKLYPEVQRQNENCTTGTCGSSCGSSCGGGCGGCGGD